MSLNFDSIDGALKAFERGEMIVVLDDENRENEGDLVIAAEHITPEKMAFFIRHTGGVVCAALSNKISDKLDLPPMVAKNTSERRTAFTVSVDAKEGISTGISAEDRAVTIKKMVDKEASAADFAKPGHVFPLIAEKGGVLWRAGHTEAGVDLCNLAGLQEVAVISELMHDDGKMMRGEELFKFSKEHGLKIITIADLINYRRQNERFIKLEAKTEIETDTGTWELRVYRDLLHDAEQIALIKGNVSSSVNPVLVRVHSLCLTGDTLGSLHCDCGEQLKKAMKQIDEEGCGILLYMEQEGRGIGLVNKIRAYELQNNNGFDTVEANEELGFPEDLREYGIGAQILVDLGINDVRLMTNNPKKIAGIQGYGLNVVEQVSIEVEPNTVNRNYLKVKKDKMGHDLKKI